MIDWFTAQEIADLRGVSVGHIRNLASLHGWRRLGVRPERYHIRDVIDSLGAAKE